MHGKGDHRMHDRAAQRMLAQDPAIARDSLYTAVVCGDREEVARILAARPEAARGRGGAARLDAASCICAYTRFTHPPTIENAWRSRGCCSTTAPIRTTSTWRATRDYTALVGVAGEGEQDSPRQPYAAALFELLLERGAEPFDIQVLYNTHFSGDMLWWLELVYRHTIDTPRGAAWGDPDWTMFDMGGYGSGARFLLETRAREERNLAARRMGTGARRQPERRARRVDTAISRSAACTSCAVLEGFRRWRICWRATARRDQSQPWTTKQSVHRCVLPARSR